jgi:signal peptidase
MGWRQRIEQSVQLVLAGVVIALLVGAYLGQPILLGFVETGSMEPTLEPGDGFIAVPAAASGEIEQGDVVVFEAQQLNGGGLTTHRVVGETDAGYVTRGDANPFTDQDGNEPPVTDGQIVATALQVNGEVVVIPQLGTASDAIGSVVGSVQRAFANAFGTRLFLGTQGLALFVVGLGAAVLLHGALFEDDRQRTDRQRDRSRRRDGVYDPRRLVLAMALFITLISGGTMVAMSNTQEYGMISAEFGSEDPTTVPAGESSTVTYPALNAGQLPVYAFYSPASENVETDPGPIRMDRGAQYNVTITLQAPPETGFYPQYIQEYRYFAVLPEAVIVGLYRLHPWLPILAVSLTMGGAVLLLGFAIAGTEPVRIRDSERNSWL